MILEQALVLSLAMNFNTVTDIKKEAKRQKMDCELALSVASLESGFKFVSNDGNDSHGIFQIQNGTARHYCGEGAFTTERNANIYCGIKVLKEGMKGKFLFDGIVSYNSYQPYICKNDKQVKKFGCVYPMYINQDYLDKVMFRYELFTKIKVCRWSNEDARRYKFQHSKGYRKS